MFTLLPHFVTLVLRVMLFNQHKLLPHWLLRDDQPLIERGIKCTLRTYQTLISAVNLNSSKIQAKSTHVLKLPSILKYTSQDTTSLSIIRSLFV